ncbi:hypothetical protein GTA08_BOTSDO09765 [Botryosphaeria dothidea]|uniref:Uncharacterized protein n=1 Tax=Botryosphaeria dothidea TaxID=55169 RepID=A0A8H4MWU0_9PEZI|nr:hypothetical protein GTA08_BOTSDO09765 [Botryosphaeria dothidea]
MTLSNEAIIAIVSLIIQLVAPIISHYYRAGNLNDANRWRILMRAEASGWILDFEENNRLRPAPGPGLLARIRDGVLRKARTIKEFVVRMVV